MRDSTSTLVKLQALVKQHNQELALRAGVKALMGIVFSFATFGFLFWLFWFVGWFAAGMVNLHPWQFGLLAAGIFLIVSTWSAWRQVDPLAGVERLTNQQWILTQLSLASPTTLYFSPRHAIAGSAVMLLGGPANVFNSLGLWAYRLRADESRIEEAAELLPNCVRAIPVEKVASPESALLLKRLKLIKVVAHGNSVALALTEKGSKLLPVAKALDEKKPTKKNKPSA